MEERLEAYRLSLIQIGYTEEKAQAIIEDMKRAVQFNSLEEGNK